MRLFAIRTRDDESCQLVIPHDHRHKEVYNALIMKTETKPKTEVFLAKPTETDRRQNFWNRNNTSTICLLKKNLEHLLLFHILIHSL